MKCCIVGVSGVERLQKDGLRLLPRRAAPTVASVSALHLHVKWQEMNAGVVLIWSGMLFIRLLSEELFHCDKINHLLYQHFY